MKIAVPDLVSNSYFPAIAALELGFFERGGLDLTLEHIFPVTTCLELMRAGEVAFVAGTAHAVPQVFPGGEGAKLLAALAQRMYWLLVLRTDLGAKRGELEAVKGLRIGAAPMVEQGLRGLLADAGIDIERDAVTIRPVPGSSAAGASFGLQAAKALQDGLIDGFWANGLGAECAVRSGAGTVVLDVRRGDGPERGQGLYLPGVDYIGPVNRGGPGRRGSRHARYCRCSTRLEKRCQSGHRCWKPAVPGLRGEPDCRGRRTGFAVLRSAHRYSRDSRNR